MKKLKLPPNYPRRLAKTKIISARVDESRFQKWEKLQLKDNKFTLIRPSDLMEYMIDYFHEEIYGKDEEKIDD